MTYTKRFSIVCTYCYWNQASSGPEVQETADCRRRVTVIPRQRLQGHLDRHGGENQRRFKGDPDPERETDDHAAFVVETVFGNESEARDEKDGKKYERS